MPIQKDFFENKDDHAGEMETSLMMYLRPDLVLPLSEAADGSAKKFKFEAIREGWAWAERQWTKVTESTGIRRSAQSDQRKRRKIF
jgi:Uncharacterized protein, putative amidase